jgi:hypothetical protein
LGYLSGNQKEKGKKIIRKQKRKMSSTKEFDPCFDTPLFWKMYSIEDVRWKSQEELERSE